MIYVDYRVGLSFTVSVSNLWGRRHNHASEANSGDTNFGLTQGTFRLQA